MQEIDEGIMSPSDTSLPEDDIAETQLVCSHVHWVDDSANTGLAHICESSESVVR